MAKNKTATTVADEAVGTTAAQATEAAAETTEGTQAAESSTDDTGAATQQQDASNVADVSANGEVLPAHAVAITALEAQVLELKAQLAAAQAPALVAATAPTPAPVAAFIAGPQRYDVVGNLEHNGESYSVGGAVYLTEKQAAPLLGHTVVRA